MRRVIFWCALKMFPKRSVILLWFFLVFLIAALVAYLSFGYVYEEMHHHHHLPESWSPDISATVTWHVTRLSQNLARHVFLVPGDSYDDLMVGS